MDILMGQEIHTIYGDQKAAQEYYFAIVQEIKKEEESTYDSKMPKIEPDGEYELFVLDQLKPKQTVRIGRAYW